MKTVKSSIASMVGIACLISAEVYALKGKLNQVYNYSYLNGLLLNWDAGYTDPTNCPNPNRMTVRGDDVNGQAMIGMVFIALTTDYTLNCVPKPDCNGINGTAEANYCIMSKG
ncbi:hypothetical protein FKG94_07880 [Exilibacterium tricleocarpae]|uniref:Uncharacterized protein n=1 Tax=Exilibacterium tricleocarpae TaxID=2591008 RepID=A0A545TZK4_9GAMM|nr:hypothetical protein [Exilibacterium tricleocarpae]TQV82637.1 hypothetical protein FKG94_07880 [Exilibacterium tricleocarpae]